MGAIMSRSAKINPLPVVCDACKKGPFKRENFHQAIDKWGDDAGQDANLKHEYTYTRTWGVISNSAAREGCHWCKLMIRVRDALPDESFPRGGAEEEVTIRIIIRISSPVDWTDVTNWLEIHLNDFKASVYYIYAEQNNIASGEIGLGPHFRDSPSYVDYEEAKKCLENCSRNHDTCPAALETTLPTRLIDCSKPDSPRIFETHRKLKGQYVTLSYVWGGDQKQKTTKSNLRKYIHEGLPKELPQTIADAVVATHKLGLRWLWVDAFCIIQDSDEDKLRELADMGHIYQDSYVTLSILSSFRADHGFLPDEGEHPELPFHCADGQIGTMKLRYYIQRPGRRRSVRYQTVSTYDPLNGRAWCFQETILSPRRIVLQPPRVMYACRGYMQDITRPEEGGEGGPPLQLPDTALFSDQKKGKLTRDDDSMHDIWDGLIRGYSSCKITWPGDKLVAFASIAEVYQSITKDEYLAGLWRSELLDGLLWESAMGLGERPREYRAPTWSWTSIDADEGVLMHRPHMLEMPSTEYEASVVSCVVIPKSHIHPLGEIKEATLTLKVKMHSLMNDGRNCRFIEEKPTVTKRAFEETTIGGGWLAPSGSCLGDGDANSTCRVHFDSKEGTERDRDMDFYVIALRAGRKWGDQPQPGFMLGLLAMKVGGLFRRVARIHLTHYPVWLDNVSQTVVTMV